MSRVLLGCAAAVATLAFPLASPAGAQDDLARRLADTIETGEVDEPGTEVRWGRATGVVDAPVEEVQRIVRDYGNYAEFLPHFRASRVLSRRGDNAVVYLQASVIRNTATLWAQVRIFARRPQGATQVTEGRMTDGNMDRFVARWEVTPIDGGRRSLVAFQILIEPDLPFPASVFTRENVKAARRTISALRRRVVDPAVVASRIR